MDHGKNQMKELAVSSATLHLMVEHGTKELDGFALVDRVDLGYDERGNISGIVVLRHVMTGTFHGAQWCVEDAHHNYCGHHGAEDYLDFDESTMERDSDCCGDIVAMVTLFPMHPVERIVKGWEFIDEGDPKC